MPLDFTNDKSTLVQVMAGAVRQQSITWANVDPDLCRHMVSLGQNELMVILGGEFTRFLQHYPVFDSMHCCPCQCCLESSWLIEQQGHLSLEIPRIAEDYHLSATPQLSGPLELHSMEQDYSQLYPLRMSTLTHWRLDTLRTYNPELTQ